MTASVTVRYELRGAAAKLMRRRDTEILLAGSAGTGKSRACMVKLHLAALKYPGMDGLVVRKVARSLASSFVTEWELVTKEMIDSGGLKFFGGSPRKPPQYQYENGSTVTMGGLDDPIKIMSTQRDMIYAQEATELLIPDWESLTTRLRATRMPYKQLLADCNPDAETHWLKQRANRGDVTLLVSRHEDNPRYFHADGTPTEEGVAYLAILDKLTGVRYLRLRKGLWVAAEGIIYDGYDAAVHLLDRFKIPQSWTRWWSVDFGFKNPFVCQWWAEDGDGRLYLYREIYMSQRLVEDHARDILLAVTRIVGDVPDRRVLTAKDIREDVQAGRREWIEPKPRGIVRDHDAEDAATLERHLGLSTIPAKKAVGPGIEAVQSRMKGAGDGRPRIFYLRDALIERDKRLDGRGLPCSTVEEISGYVWDDRKEAPVKENDHGMDAERYLVSERDLGSRPRVRFIG